MIDLAGFGEGDKDPATDSPRAPGAPRRGPIDHSGFGEGYKPPAPSGGSRIDLSEFGSETPGAHPEVPLEEQLVTPTEKLMIGAAGATEPAQAEWLSRRGYETTINS